MDASSYLNGRVGDFATIIESDEPPLVGEQSSFSSWDSDEPNLLWYAGDSVEGLIYNEPAGPIQP